MRTGTTSYRYGSMGIKGSSSVEKCFPLILSNFNVTCAALLRASYVILSYYGSKEFFVTILKRRN